MVEMIIGTVMLALGICAGIVIAHINMKPKTTGTLRIYSDPDDGPYLFVELKSDPMNVMKEKFVTFDVNPEDYISQK